MFFSSSVRIQSEFTGGIKRWCQTLLCVLHAGRQVVGIKPTNYEYIANTKYILCVFVRASLHVRREEKQTRCCTTAVVQHPSSSWTHSLLPCTWPPTTNNQELHTIGGNNTHIVSSSWWWTYKYPKHVENIISAIKHSVTSSWFFFSTKYISFSLRRCPSTDCYNVCLQTRIGKTEQPERIDNKHFVN